MAKMPKWSAWALVVLALFAGMADARIPRSHAAIAEFKRLHPCPANGARSGPCGGFIVDHAHSLCMGGKDEPANMRWQTVKKAKLKDRWECKPGWEKKLAACEVGGCFVTP